MGSPREWLNNNAAVATVVAVVVLLLALLLLIGFNKAQSSKDKAASGIQTWYYDLGTGKRFTGPASERPPFKTDSGPENGVRLYMFACGDCKNEQFEGFLEKLSDDAKKALEAPAPPPAPAPGEHPTPGGTPPPWRPAPPRRTTGEGKLVASLSNTNTWFPMTSHEGQEIVQAVKTRCAGKGDLRPCPPPPN
jgi:hypothetical protein